MTSTLDVPAAREFTSTDEPRIRNAIAMIVSRFPRIDETFILREINELERQGQPIVLVPLIREHAPVLHEEAKPWLQRALYLPLLSRSIVASNLAHLARKPVAYIGLLLRLIGGTLFHPAMLLRTLALFPKSVSLAGMLSRLGVKHVHAHFASQATTTAYIIGSLTDITYSFTVHGPDIFVHRSLLRRKIAGAKFIRAVSTFNKAFLLGLYPLEAGPKVEVIHVGVNPEIYAGAAAAQAPARERPMILSVAALAESKGFPFLVDAIADLVKHDVKLECRIIGDGPLRGATERWIAKHGLSDTVRLSGLLRQDEVARLMGECEIFVLPSVIARNGNMDGIPISLMEAMAAGKPVIASALSGIPELVDHQISGLLVDATHPERIAAAVHQLIENPPMRERMGRAGQQKVRENFDIRRIATSLLDLFDRREDAAVPAAQQIARLAWHRLGACAIGIRRVRERQDSRVAEVAVSDGVTKRDVVVKQQKRSSGDWGESVDRARHEFDVMSRLRSTLHSESAEATSDIVYSIPRVLLFDRRNASVVMERAHGIPIKALVREARVYSRPARLISPLRRAGTWLRLMESVMRLDADGRPLLRSRVRRALRDLDLVGIDHREIRRGHERVADTIEALESRLAERPIATVWQHGDYRPSIVFIGDRRVEAIDFETFHPGVAYEDAAHFVVHLHMAFSHRPFRGMARNLVESFLSGYTNSGPVDRSALALFSIIKALEILAGGKGHGIACSPRKRRVLRNIIMGQAV